MSWLKENRLQLVNLLGSVASLVGFAILILSLISANNGRPPEVVAWQYIGFFGSVIFISATVVYTFFWISEGILQERKASTNVLIASAKLLAGTAIAGIGFDGLISAIHWTWMLSVPLSLFWTF